MLLKNIVQSKWNNEPEAESWTHHKGSRKLVNFFILPTTEFWYVRATQQIVLLLLCILCNSKNLISESNLYHGEYWVVEESEGSGSVKWLMRKEEETQSWNQQRIPVNLPHLSSGHGGSLGSWAGIKACTTADETHFAMYPLCFLGQARVTDSDYYLGLSQHSSSLKKWWRFCESLQIKCSSLNRWQWQKRKPSTTPLKQEWHCESRIWAPAEAIDP